MNIEKYNVAVKIQDERDSLELAQKRMKNGLCDEIKIELKTGYADMGRDITFNVKFKGDIAMDIYMAIDNILIKRIAQLEQQFNEL